MVLWPLSHSYPLFLFLFLTNSRATEVQIANEFHSLSFPKAHASMSLTIYIGITLEIGSLGSVVLPDSKLNYYSTKTSAIGANKRGGI